MNRSIFIYIAFCLLFVSTTAKGKIPDAITENSDWLSEKASSQVTEMESLILSDIPMDDFSCTLTISGYGTVEGFGRIRMTISSTKTTCKLAAKDLRETVIQLQLRINQ